MTDLSINITNQYKRKKCLQLLSPLMEVCFYFCLIHSLFNLWSDFLFIAVLNCNISFKIEYQCPVKVCKFYCESILIIMYSPHIWIITGCAGSVSKILQRVPGVVSVDKVSVKEKNAKINVDQSFKADDAVQSLTKAGFTAKQL